MFHIKHEENSEANMKIKSEPHDMDEDSDESQYPLSEQCINIKQERTPPEDVTDSEKCKDIICSEMDQIDNKHEDYLPVDTKLEDIKQECEELESNFSLNEQDYIDIKHEILPTSVLIPSLEIKSEESDKYMGYNVRTLQKNKPFNRNLDSNRQLHHSPSSFNYEETHSHKKNYNKQNMKKQEYPTDHTYAVYNKTFLLPRKLSRRQKIQAGNRHSCHICKETFSRKINVTKHTVVHPHSRDSFKRTSSNRSNLSMHKDVERNNCPFTCQICKKSFKLKIKLSRHLRIHNNNYSCGKCGKFYHYLYLLKRHERVHTGERPYSCDICKKSYTRRSSVIRHNRDIHKGERPFICEVCEKTFSDKRNLFDHVLIHEGVKPYKCDICKKSFRSRGRIAKHMRSHT